eukprot:Unigene1023_Nuclearia_a/m.3260 Unigene1023_Nuclearia_a/g.3260  ORF Unigene1023_Nuclearia_a/g.3260 Unigene1023_Nuclearia_a/m.3260 type:complete len:434 (-) Unigene1023_Nuclearia_a:1077-2378(-)
MRISCVPLPPGGSVDVDGGCTCSLSVLGTATCTAKFCSSAGVPLRNVIVTLITCGFIGSFCGANRSRMPFLSYPTNEPAAAAGAAGALATPPPSRSASGSNDCAGAARAGVGAPPSSSESRSLAAAAPVAAEREGAGTSLPIRSRSSRLDGDAACAGAPAANAAGAPWGGCASAGDSPCRMPCLTSRCSGGGMRSSSDGRIWSKRKMARYSAARCCSSTLTLLTMPRSRAWMRSMPVEKRVLSFMSAVRTYSRAVVDVYGDLRMLSSRSSTSASLIFTCASSGSRPSPRTSTSPNSPMAQMAACISASCDTSSLIAWYSLLTVYACSSGEVVIRRMKLARMSSSTKLPARRSTRRIVSTCQRLLGASRSAAAAISDVMRGLNSLSAFSRKVSSSRTSTRMLLSLISANVSSSARRRIEMSPSCRHSTTVLRCR